MLLSLKSRFVGNVYVIECVGRIVLGEEVKALEAALEVAEREFTQIVLNLSEVSRLDSIAMGLLVRYAERLGKRGGAGHGRNGGPGRRHHRADVRAPWCGPGSY